MKRFLRSRLDHRGVHQVSPLLTQQLIQMHENTRNLNVPDSCAWVLLPSRHLLRRAIKGHRPLRGSRYRSKRLRIYQQIRADLRRNFAREYTETPQAFLYQFVFDDGHMARAPRPL